MTGTPPASPPSFGLSPIRRGSGRTRAQVPPRARRDRSRMTGRSGLVRCPGMHRRRPDREQFGAAHLEGREEEEPEPSATSCGAGSPSGVAAGSGIAVCWETRSAVRAAFSASALAVTRGLNGALGAKAPW